MINYYNENDPKAAAWLRELIKDGHIAKGVVDERSIEDVQPNDLTEFTQCHFFAGIGGWSYALRLAGWPDDRPVWTGSCPCQPFSTAGKGAGFADERHLWPAFFHLCRICKPVRIFGEQVANALGWLDLVSTDLEAEGYAVGAAIVGAHSVGAPHIRQRLYWVADAGSQRQQQHAERNGESLAGAEAPCGDDADGCGKLGELAQPEGEQPHWGGDARRGRGELADGSVMGNSDDEGSQGRRIRWNGPGERTTWSADLVICRDGKWRPVEPSTFPLAHGVPGRVGLLRGYGNAIVPQVAAEFVRAAMDSDHGC